MNKIQKTPKCLWLLVYPVNPANHVAPVQFLCVFFVRLGGKSLFLRAGFDLENFMSVLPYLIPGVAHKKDFAPTGKPRIPFLPLS